MQEIEIINKTTALKSPLAAGYCDSFMCRLRGLTFRRSLPEDWGLVLVEAADGRVSTAIHMLFVWFDLGVIWINDAGTVVDKRLARSWVSFIIPSRPARYVLEVRPERLAEFEIGDQIDFE